MQGSFLFTGSGGSLGVPVIGCSCAVCRSSNPKNRRMRASGLVTLREKKILLDCGPDFRRQALEYGITHLDGVVLTHAHNDHIAGLDELRAYLIPKKEGGMPCLASQETAEELRRRFGYIFDNANPEKRLLPKIYLEQLEGERGEAPFQGVSIRYMTFRQAGMKVNGFRFGSFAYLSDMHDYPETIFEDLKGVETLVLSALRYTPSRLHLSVDEAADFGRRAGAKITYLTHIAHDLEHEHTDAYLPDSVRVAYDGLEVPFHE